MSKQVIVVGAGLAGLMAAYELLPSDLKILPIVMWAGDSTVGGKRK